METRWKQDRNRMKTRWKQYRKKLNARSKQDLNCAIAYRNFIIIFKLFPVKLIYFLLQVNGNKNYAVFQRSVF